MHRSASNPPLISIGIPTYNRAAGLRVALESALAQDYSRLEIIVTDNASTDATAEVAESFCRADSRVRLVRHPVNRGPTSNFDSARQQAAGDYFIWLADDDWLGPGYVRRCMEELEAHPDHTLVCGRVRYYKQGKYVFDGQQLDLPGRSGNRRVLQYYRQVGDNGNFYGLMRREQMLRVPFINVMGGDWLFLAAIAFLGKVRTLPDVTIHRDFTWDDTSHERLVKSLGLPAFQERHPYLAIATAAYHDIRQNNPVYQRLSGTARWWLACRAWRIICRRHGLRLPRLLGILWSERRAA